MILSVRNVIHAIKNGSTVSFNSSTEICRTSRLQNEIKYKKMNHEEVYATVFHSVSTILNYGRHFRFGEVPLKTAAAYPFKWNHPYPSFWLNIFIQFL